MRNFIRDREEALKVKEIVEKEQTETNKINVSIDKNAGGAIAHIRSNKSLYFNKWIQDIQKHNPLIGKHVAAAPEYSIDSLELEGQEVTELTDDLKRMIERGAASFNPEEDSDSPNVENRESIKNDKDAEQKFIDINIIEIATKKNYEKDDSIVEKRCVELLKAYHDDSNYETKIPIIEIIKNYKSILTLENIEKKKLEK